MEICSSLLREPSSAMLMVSVLNDTWKAVSGESSTGKASDRDRETETETERQRQRERERERERERVQTEVSRLSHIHSAAVTPNIMLGALPPKTFSAITLILGCGKDITHTQKDVHHKLTCRQCLVEDS